MEQDERSTFLPGLVLAGLGQLRLVIFGRIVSLSSGKTDRSSLLQVKARSHLASIGSCRNCAFRY